MRYLIKQKWLSVNASFTIEDEMANPVYRCKGKISALGDQLSLTNLHGEELYAIRQKLLAWKPTYHVYQQGEIAAVVTRDLFSFFKPRFQINLAMVRHWKSTGIFYNTSIASPRMVWKSPGYLNGSFLLVILMG